MKNEKIVIFGDSYSTYEGYLPKGQGTHYPSKDGTVDDVSKTWWGMIANETDSQIILNDSWAGTTICNTGYHGDCSKTSSFIFRLKNHIKNGFFEENKIDRVFVFGATNDSWTKNSSGSVMFGGWCEDDLKLILPGISYFMNLLVSQIGSQKICFIINTDLRDEITEGIIEICEHYNTDYVLLCDFEKDYSHPSFEGMKQIKNQILAKLDEKN